MAYRWTRDKPLYRVGDSDVAPGEVFTPSQPVQDRFGRWLEAVDDDAKADDDADTEESAEPEYAEMDYSELRQKAVDADTEEINGRSSKDEIVAWLEENA